MFDIYKICVFIGMYCLTLGIGFFESFRHLKADGIIVKSSLALRNSAYALLGSSVVLLSTGILLYQNL